MSKEDILGRPQLKGNHKSPTASGIPMGDMFVFSGWSRQTITEVIHEDAITCPEHELSI